MRLQNAQNQTPFRLGVGSAPCLLEQFVGELAQIDPAVREIELDACSLAFGNGCRFRKLSPFDSRSATNQNMIAE
jgi:hypothetical protein